MARFLFFSFSTFLTEFVTCQPGWNPESRRPIPKPRKFLNISRAEITPPTSEEESSFSGLNDTSQEIEARKRYAQLFTERPKMQQRRRPKHRRHREEEELSDSLSDLSMSQQQHQQLFPGEDPPPIPARGFAGHATPPPRSPKPGRDRPRLPPRSSKPGYSSSHSQSDPSPAVMGHDYLLGHPPPSLPERKWVTKKGSMSSRDSSSEPESPVSHSSPKKGIFGFFTKSKAKKERSHHHQEEEQSEEFDEERDLIRPKKPSYIDGRPGMRELNAELEKGFKLNKRGHQ